MTTFRIASTGDAEEMLAIYKTYILETAFTFETEVPSVADFEKRIEKYLQKYPWLVCEVNGKIAGYTYASLHREREAYQWTCECSVYIHNDFKGKGIGAALYSVLFQILKLQGFRNVYAGITMPNEASENLHQKCGFERFAVYESVGYKFNGWHKVGWWRLQINEYDPKPSPPLAFSKMDCNMFNDLFQSAARKIEAGL